MNDQKQRLSSFRSQIQTACDAFILPLTDEFMGEYIPESESRLGWLTGFSGSAGTAVVTKDHAVFFTDGRYTLQAKDEVGGVYDIINIADKTVDAWLAANLKSGAVIAADPTLHTVSYIRRLQKAVDDAGLKLQFVDANPVDAIWKERPAAPTSKATMQPLQYAGSSAKDKCKEIAVQIENKKANALFITANDSLCWLLNMRGSDVPCTPFVRAYGALQNNGTVDLFIDAGRVTPDLLKSWGDTVRIHPPAALKQWFAAQKEKAIAIDPSFASAWVERQCTAAGARIVLMEDPCQLAKACKHAAEIEGARLAHRKDGLALTRFLHHLSRHHRDMTEQDVCDKLLAFRMEDKDFIEPSFPTISGSGANGAIVHYRTTPKSNKKLEANTLMLIDSGGQYPFGTTDVTRTIAIGTPSQEMKECFTRVLKGHIALATAVFPEGTNGMQLDSLARQYLWQAGLDYDHGTGHGVGSYLSVHEGPQRISKKSSDVPLRPGMIISNEPGYYSAGAFGIRIENLVVVIERFTGGDGRKYFGFETLTLAPIDTSLIVKDMLSVSEVEWLGTYHKRVQESHVGSLNAEEKEWLAKVTVV